MEINNNKKVQEFVEKSNLDMDVRVLQDAEDALLWWDSCFVERYGGLDVDVLETVAYMRTLRKRLEVLRDEKDRIREEESHD